MDGTSWDRGDGWLSDSFECDWWGVDCYDSQIQKIELVDNDLHGMLPIEMIVTFEDLRSLSLRRNTINGTLPTELGSMTNLEYLSLSSNTITGTLPTELGS